MKRTLGYVPSVIFAIVEVLIVIVVLDDASYADNTKVMAGLALLYALIRTSAMNLGLMIDSQSLMFAGQLIQIKELINKGDDIEIDREDLKKVQEKVGLGHIKLIIRAIGVVIIYLVALTSLMD